MVYNNKKSSFNDLLAKDGSVSIYHRNLQKLAGLSSEIVNELFQFREQIPYELSKGLSFKSLGFIQFLVVQKALNFWAEDMATRA